MYNKKVLLFNETVLNIIRNFIPHEAVTFDDRDPPWITCRIKKTINDKNLAFKHFVKNKDNVKNNSYLEKFSSLQKNLSCLIETSKQEYFSKIVKKLSDPNTSSKTYWSILKSLLTGKKVPCIPPIFHKHKFITDFREKAELFNSFFANKCSLITNTSVLPINCESLTDKSLSSISFTDNDIGKIIKSLDPNKAHGHDMMSIRMLKICGDSIYKPLHLIFRASLDQGTFPLRWKKANVVPIYKKYDKQSMKNYRPVSLLPICGKIFERLLYNEMFSFFIENGLISQNQSGIKPGDSCINQLLSMIHEI